MKQEFQIKENGFDEIKKAMILRTTLIALLAGGVGLAISYFNTNEQSSDVNTLPYVIPIMIGAIAFGLFRGLNRQKGLFESYRLTVGEHEITREQKNTQTISIPFNEVKSIIRYPKGVLGVVGHSKTDIIIVPAQINNSEKLEEILTQVQPIIDASEKTSVEKYRGLLSLSTLGLMAAVFISTNKLIVGITGTILVLLLSYSFYEVRRNKNIDKKTKGSIWWLIIIILSIVATMYVKLTGNA